MLKKIKNLWHSRTINGAIVASVGTVLQQYSGQVDALSGAVSWLHYVSLTMQIAGIVLIAFARVDDCLTGKNP